MLKRISDPDEQAGMVVFFLSDYSSCVSDSLRYAGELRLQVQTSPARNFLSTAACRLGETYLDYEHGVLLRSYRACKRKHAMLLLFNASSFVSLYTRRALSWPGTLYIGRASASVIFSTPYPRSCESDFDMRYSSVFFQPAGALHEPGLFSVEYSWARSIGIQIITLTSRHPPLYLYPL